MEIIKEKEELLTSEQFKNLQEKRWSPRSFKKEQISPEKIKQIFDAGRDVASSYNEQPWYFILMSKEDSNYQKLFDCMGDFNQNWAGNAPYLGVAIGKKYFSRKESEKKPNRHYFYDVGAFMSVATLKATTLDLYIHQMAGFSPEKVMENFSIPEDYEALTMFVIGKLGDGSDLSEELKKKENPHSERKPINDFLFSNEWEHPFNKQF